MQNINQIVGANLTALRKAKKLTQQEVGLALSYSDKSISKWELGNALPSVDILKELADFYDVTVDYLLTEGNEKKADEVINKQNDKSSKSNKAIIFAMLITVVWLIMASVYVSTVIQHGMPGLWVIFIWGVPGSSFVAYIGSRALWGKNISIPILLSVFCLSLLLAFCIQFWFQYEFTDTPRENIWYILIILIPLETIIWLLYLMRKKKH